MYRPGLTAEELKELEAVGLKPEDVEDNSDQEVWKENWTAFLIFMEIRTQWRVGMNGFTGLDYNVIIAPGGIFDMFDIPKKKRLSLLDDIKVMEDEALKQMSRKS